MVALLLWQWTMSGRDRWNARNSVQADRRAVRGGVHVHGHAVALELRLERPSRDRRNALQRGGRRPHANGTARDHHFRAADPEAVDDVGNDHRTFSGSPFQR